MTSIEKVPALIERIASCKVFFIVASKRSYSLDILGAPRLLLVFKYVRLLICFHESKSFDFTSPFYK